MTNVDVIYLLLWNDFIIFSFVLSTAALLGLAPVLHPGPHKNTK